ncbi:Hypothetical predicted protein [Paramuricea clavata]|uniref:Uncharacterized protein n=1 Tax=Paramuricea clavata TaxID=317549 RepID=A0A6S7GWI0_PARCT|nr:Hypothetical predicted protein [Paramuricea clavata]
MRQLQPLVTIRNTLKSSPNESIIHLWKSTTNHANIQYDQYSSTKEVIKSFRDVQEDKLTNQLTYQGSFFTSVLRFSLTQFLPRSIITWRHDSILNFIADNLPSEHIRTIYADTLSSFSNLSTITGDDYRPDLLILTKDNCLYILELTVGYETNLRNNVNRKYSKYKDMIMEQKKKGVFDKESSGFIDMLEHFNLDKAHVIYVIKMIINIAIRRTDVTKDDDEVRAKCKYEESFNFFCERFVKEKLIDNEEIYYMKKIEAEFVRTVATIENCDASGYRRFRLKESICQGVVAEYYLNEESETSQSEMESEDEVLDYLLLKNHEKLLSTFGESF